MKRGSRVKPAAAPVRPQTCEWCRWWQAMIGAFGRVTIVCQCEDSPKWLHLTGAGDNCFRWTPKGKG